MFQWRQAGGGGGRAAGRPGIRQAHSASRQATSCRMIRPGSAAPSWSPPRRVDEIGAGGVADGFASAPAGANCAPAAAAPTGRWAAGRGGRVASWRDPCSGYGSGPAPRRGCCRIASLSARPGLLIQPAPLPWNADRHAGERLHVPACGVSRRVPCANLVGPPCNRPCPECTAAGSARCREAAGRRVRRTNQLDRKP